MLWVVTAYRPDGSWLSRDLSRMDQIFGNARRSEKIVVSFWPFERFVLFSSKSDEMQALHDTCTPRG